MGFFTGVVSQLNTIDERNAAFAKEERDRAERRKELQDALKEKRMAAIITAAASRGLMLPEGAGVDGTAAAGTGSVTEAGGLTKDTGSRPSTSAVKGHYTGILLKDFKADPDLVAPFAALGESNIKEIYDAVDTVRAAYDDAGRAAEFTPDVVNNVLKNVRVTVSKGGTVYYDDLLKMSGLDQIPEEDRKYMDFMLRQGASAKVTVLGQKPQFPMKIEDIQRYKEAAKDDFLGTLESKLVEVQQKITRGGGDPGDLGAEQARLSKAINQIKEAGGTVSPEILEKYGPDVMLPYVMREPRLLIGSIGGWQGAAINSLRENKAFSTEQAAKEAVMAGLIKDGDEITIKGKKVKVGTGK